MNAHEQQIALFQTRVRQMILRFEQLSKENEELYVMLDNAEKTMEELRSEVAQKQRAYDSLKMAKMIEITDGDLENARTRLSKLIRDVNKCIAVLTEQK